MLLLKRIEEFRLSPQALSDAAEGFSIRTKHEGTEDGVSFVSGIRVG
jgi:hypothetical protein